VGTADVSVSGDLETCYTAVRRQTEDLCTPLATEDYVIQSMPAASPVKWHLAHTSWFFETFVLQPRLAGYQPFHPQFGFLFNSYYQGVGPRWPQPERGLLSRPTVADVYRYRAYVDEHMARVLRAEDPSLRAVVSLGLNHEQQHQELILTDLKHAWAANPLHPVYRTAVAAGGDPPHPAWVSFPEGLAWVGHDGAGFAFDNESPRHRVFLNGFLMSSRLATNAEYLAFIADDGYARPDLWLSDGWDACQAQGWNAPLHWAKEGSAWMNVTLAGLRPLEQGEPVCHVSYYEADAFARWASARLPTEAEWEAAAGSVAMAGHFLESGHFHPAAAASHRPGAPLSALRRCLAVDREQLFSLSRLPRAGWSSGRVQRQVHVQPTGPARRLVCYAAQSRPPKLPQLLPAGRPLAVQRHPFGAGS
jgi:ergothioneine biosynthesis protein EgtB